MTKINKSVWFLIGWLCICLPFTLESRIYFIHIPKTGGTTLRFLLEQGVDGSEIYPLRNTLRDAIPVTHALVSGHFPLSYCAQIDPAFDAAFKITILRDPIERYLSFLRAKTQGQTPFSTLEAVFENRQLFPIASIQNGLCHYLAIDPSLEGEALLESAKQGLRTLDCVLLYDNLLSDLIALFNRLGTPLTESQIPHLNRSPTLPASSVLIKKIEAVNKLDIELYKYAIHYFNRDNHIF